MRKVILLVQVIRPLLFKRYLLFIFLIIFSTEVYAQQIDSLGFIDSLTNLIIRQEAESDIQNRNVAELRERLTTELSKNKVLDKTTRTRLWIVLRDLESKKGVYTALNPKYYVDKKIYEYERKYFLVIYL